ncbi:MAG: BlaI/MecI/CopY family transcriptional regulator [Rhizobacter sp.]|nr:BlaI/MecI/CopY family transcriptional regulator [Chlorobiales bacterium]
MSKQNFQPSPLEWEVMNTIWDVSAKSPHGTSVREVMDAAYPKGERAYTTVQTVMNSLTAKGFLKREKIGLVGFYKPLRKRDDTVKKEVKTFAGKVFGGSLTELANYLVSSDTLSREEIMSLKKLIDQKAKK